MTLRDMLYGWSYEGVCRMESGWWVKWVKTSNYSDLWTGMPHGIVCRRAYPFSKLEVVFCGAMAENNFVNALILFIGVGITIADA